MRSPRNDFLISLSPSWSGSPFIPKWPPSLSPKDPVTSHSSQDRDLFTVFKIREDEKGNGNWSLDRHFPILMRKLRFSSTLLRIGWQIWLTLTYFEFWIVNTYCKLMMWRFYCTFWSVPKMPGIQNVKRDADIFSKSGVTGHDPVFSNRQSPQKSQSPFRSWQTLA